MVDPSMSASKSNVSITTDLFNYSFKPNMETKLWLFTEHGFRYLHWCDDWNNDVAYTKEDMALYNQLMESVGLKCLDVHGTATETIRIDSEDEGLLRKYTELLENRIEFCSVVGGDAVVVHPPRPQSESVFGPGLERSIRVLDRVRSLAEDFGVTIALENCSPYDERVIEALLAVYPPGFVGFCYDSGHANIHGNLERLKGFGDRLRVLHLHDNRGEKDDHQPPYWGTIDWPNVMKWIRESGYRKPVNFEIAHDSELFEGTMEEYMLYAVKAIDRAMVLY